MDFFEQVKNVAPYFENKSQKFQIDLVFQRTDKVITIAEIKFHKTRLKPTIIAEVEKKVQLLNIPKSITLEKALITIEGVEKSVAESGYFHHILTLEDYF